MALEKVAACAHGKFPSASAKGPHPHRVQEDYLMERLDLVYREVALQENLQTVVSQTLRLLAHLRAGLLRYRVPSQELGLWLCQVRGS